MHFLLPGLYFGFITLSTIGLGDYVFVISSAKGLGLLFTLVRMDLRIAALSFAYLILLKYSAGHVHSMLLMFWFGNHYFFQVGLALFSEWHSALGRIVQSYCTKMLRKYAGPEDKTDEQIMALFTEDELAIANTAFSVADADGSGRIDPSELPQAFWLCGLEEVHNLSSH